MNSVLLSLLLFYALYVGTVLLLSIRQIAHLKSKTKADAVLLLPQQYIDARNYALEKEKFSMNSHALELVTMFFWLFYGLKWLQPLELKLGLTGSVVAIMMMIVIGYFIELPLSVYKTFNLDKRYGFTQTTVKLFILDQLKSGGLFLFFGAPIIASVVYFISFFSAWWLITFAFLFFVIVVANLIYPTIIAPMFNKFVPLQKGELSDAINELANKCGFELTNIYTIDAGKRDKRLNAYFAGFGKSKRVVLYDTLIEKLTTQEIVAVLAHELGHFTHKDIFKNMAATGVLLFGFCLVLGNIPLEIFQGLGITKGAFGTISLFMLFSTALGFFAMPIISSLSKKNEYAADAFAAKVHEAKALISALTKLSDENKAFPTADKLFSFFYHSHPSVIMRIEQLSK